MLFRSSRLGDRRVALGLLLVGSILLVGCSQPLTQSVAQAGQETKRAVVGYDNVSYTYPVTVPGTRRQVTIVSPEPLDFEPTYDDYLAWQNGEKIWLRIPAVENP